MNRRFHGWLHRHGIARVLNTASSSAHDRGTAYVQAAGPCWLARVLAGYAVRHSPSARLDWASLAVRDTEHTGRWQWRVRFGYRRIR